MGRLWRSRTNEAQECSRLTLRSGGVQQDGETITWDQTYHFDGSFAFATQSYECDTCAEKIGKGELLSQGKRGVGDAECCLDVTGVDRVHWECSWDEKQGFGYPDKVAEDETEEEKTRREDKKRAEHVAELGDVTLIPGWTALTPQQKTHWLSTTGKDVTTEALNKKQVFMNVKCCVMGEFDERENLEESLVAGGALISKSVIKSMTHLIAGRSGTNEYGMTTGPGSKKFTAAKKVRGAVILTEEQVNDAIKRFALDHIPLVDRTDIGHIHTPAIAKKKSKPTFALSDDSEEKTDKNKGETATEQRDVMAEQEQEQKEVPMKKGKGKRKAIASSSSSSTSSMDDTAAETETQAAADEEPANKKSKALVQHTSASLSSLSRRQLQTLAKRAGLKASASSAQLIVQLTRSN